ncbi:MAG: efflux RND transporter periplasmic adaptor subunit [Gemmatimonadota bacterium]
MKTRSVILLAAAGPGIAALAACGASEANPADDALTELIATVESRDLEVEAEAPGSVEPILVVDVKSRASGEILAVHAETGDVVERGDLLVEVDPRDVRNDLNQAEADVEVARVRADIAQEQLARTRELLESGVVTEQEYESVELEAANAQSTLVRAETTLELAQQRMNDVTIRAPISGTIIERAVEVGQIIASAMNNVSGGETLLSMADLSEVQVRTLVDETDIGRISPGLTTRVQVEAFPNQTFVGEVLKVEPQAVVDQNVTMFPVLIRLENPDRLLKPGMNSEVQIEIASRTDVLTVPNAAVVPMAEATELGTALGLSPEAIRDALSAGGGEQQGGPGGGAVAADGPQAELQRRCQELRSRMSEGGDGPGSLSEEERETMRECIRLLRERGQRANAGEPGEPRPAVVFVDNGSEIEPRRVMLGVNDWEHTEVVEGLEADERVVLVSVARIQQSNEDLTNRIRERTSGPFRGGN